MDVQDQMDKEIQSITHLLVELRDVTSRSWAIEAYGKKPEEGREVPQYRLLVIQPDDTLKPVVFPSANADRTTTDLATYPMMAAYITGVINGVINAKPDLQPSQN